MALRIVRKTLESVAPLECNDDESWVASRRCAQSGRRTSQVSARTTSVLPVAFICRASCPPKERGVLAIYTKDVTIVKAGTGLHRVNRGAALSHASCLQAGRLFVGRAGGATAASPPLLAGKNARSSDVTQLSDKDKLVVPAAMVCDDYNSKLARFADDAGVCKGGRGTAKGQGRPRSGLSSLPCQTRRRVRQPHRAEGLRYICSCARARAACAVMGVRVCSVRHRSFDASLDAPYRVMQRTMYACSTLEVLAQSPSSCPSLTASLRSFVLPHCPQRRSRQSMRPHDARVVASFGRDASHFPVDHRPFPTGFHKTWWDHGGRNTKKCHAGAGAILGGCVMLGHIVSPELIISVG